MWVSTTRAKNIEYKKTCVEMDLLDVCRMAASSVCSRGIIWLSKELETRFSDF